ncbi:MAG: RhuM family protein [Candidatus Marinimicrobia bacterium]|nr:RhuM family protein [Candidatus Neomarinimicrobiota bacterium]
MKNEIILYQSDELPSRIEVRVEENTVWLTQAQIVTLFDSSKANISEHIKHIFQTGELIKEGTVRKIRTVQKEGNRTVLRNLTHYNLDMIISIGYRVNSIRGTQFRIWANKVLKDHLLKGYSLNNRMDRIENNVQALSKKVNNIDLQINSQLLPTQGIFFDGQVFDAYTFVADLIRRAKRSLILIDSYIDDTVLTHFTKRNKDVDFYIFTQNISKQLKLDVETHNRQYNPVKIRKFDKSHDRFLIIDEKEVYHFGASLKDLGKKWFAFSRMDESSVTILSSISDML